MRFKHENAEYTYLNYYFQTFFLKKQFFFFLQLFHHPWAHYFDRRALFCSSVFYTLAVFADGNFSVYSANYTMYPSWLQAHCLPGTTDDCGGTVAWLFPPPSSRHFLDRGAYRMFDHGNGGATKTGLNLRRHSAPGFRNPSARSRECVARSSRGAVDNERRQRVQRKSFKCTKPFAIEYESHKLPDTVNVVQNTPKWNPLFLLSKTRL